MLIGQGKTNVKYLLMVAFLAAAAGALILIFASKENFKETRLQLPGKNEAVSKDFVQLFTDKVEYALGEKITITLKNNSEKPIFYISDTCFGGKYFAIDLQRYLDEKRGWENVPPLARFWPCKIGSFVGDCGFLGSGESVSPYKDIALTDGDHVLLPFFKYRYAINFFVSVV